ncbi:MAG: alcohol dehydrogenase catalytic domain-containing protein [Fimbriimonadaceae bacterium]|nr:alcohol dehydrogenase catalytic domain-containing protein [Fimbriimonadaceae bacterium]
MRVARYVGEGRVEIIEEPAPTCPAGGLLVRTLACGLCSGELMSWYMDRKIPHVLGHEVCGVVVESDSPEFSMGAKVFPHHHAPDPDSALTRRGAAVHDPVWRATRLQPGGMADLFAVPAPNLADTIRTDDLRGVDAALIEPLACVAKAIRRLHLRGDESVAVVGLGVMGLLFMLALPSAVGCDLNPERRSWAESLGLGVCPPEGLPESEVVIVCPGTGPALDLALARSAPDPRVCLFAPLAPGEVYPLDLHGLYFRDLTLTCSYSCGPEDTKVAADWIRGGLVRAEQVVSRFIALEELPGAYQEMKEGRTLKPMVIFDEGAWA